jgi:uncharacterized protein (TIGR03435 family)
VRLRRFIALRREKSLRFSISVGLLGALGVGLTAGATSMRAQQAVTPSHKFEVVSIKPNRSGAIPSGFRVTPGGRVEWTNTTLRALVRMGYQRFGFDPREVVGGLPWIDSDRFDVIATAEHPPETRPDGFPEELLAMIRALVEDHFKVTVHNERRDASIYALVLARPGKQIGSALRSVPDACVGAMKAMADKTPPKGSPPCSFASAGGKLIGTGVTMTMIANVLSGYVGRLVENRTELAGSFDFELTFDPSSAPTAPPSAQFGPAQRDDATPALFTALQEQLALKLESTRGSVDVLIVDSAQPPTEN